MQHWQLSHISPQGKSPAQLHLDYSINLFLFQYPSGAAYPGLSRNVLVHHTLEGIVLDSEHIQSFDWSGKHENLHFFDGCQSAVMHTALPPSPSPSQLRAMPLTLPACLGCVPCRTRLCDTTPTHPPPLGLCAVGQITLLHPLSVHAKERGGGAGEGPVLVALPYGRG